MLPVGRCFLEVVAPTREGTAAGRYLERRGGAGGYMVILDCDDIAPWQARVAALGVRVANDLDYGGEYRGLQLHPRDTGGTLLEINWTPGGQALDGPYHPAGPNWQSAMRVGVTESLLGVEIQAENPAALAARWRRSSIARCTTNPRAPPGSTSIWVHPFRGGDRRAGRGAVRHRIAARRPARHPRRGGGARIGRDGGHGGTLRDAGPARAGEASRHSLTVARWKRVRIVPPRESPARTEPMMKRRTLLQTAGAGAAVLAAPRLARAQKDRVLKFIPQSDLTVLDPIWTTAYVTRNHGYMVFDTLYGIDSALQAAAADGRGPRRRE